MSKEEREGGRATRGRRSRVDERKKERKNSRNFLIVIPVPSSPFKPWPFATHHQGVRIFPSGQTSRAPEERSARGHGDERLECIVLRRRSDVGAREGRRLGSGGELDDGARVAVHEAGAGGHSFVDG